MDIPKLMIASSSNDGGIVDQSIKRVSLTQKEKETKEVLNLWLELDLDEGKITFSPFAYQEGESEKEFLYLGNNIGYSSQVYVVRDVNSAINFWTGSETGILMVLLKRLPSGQLKTLLEECCSAGLFTDQGLTLDRITGMPEGVSIDYGKKKFKIDDKRISMEPFFRKILGSSLKQKYMLLVPVIKKGENRVIVSKHEEYRLFIEELLTPQIKKSKKKKSMCVCHICGKCTDSVDTVAYSTKLDRTSISKIFVTTTINYASGFDSKHHKKNFAICKECYDKWSVAEKTVMKDYRMKIAGADAILLVDGIINTMDRGEIDHVKQYVDYAFRSNLYDDWLESIEEDSLKDQDIKEYEFNLLFYKFENRKCSVYKSIEDISFIWFQYVQSAFRTIRKNNDMATYNNGFNLSSIYHMIPVAKNKAGDQLDVIRVLELYSCILKRSSVYENVLYELYADAIEKGHRQIIAKEIRNYANLERIRYYHDLYQKDNIKGLEYFIETITYEYLALKEVLIELKLLLSRGGNRIIMEENSNNNRADIVLSREEFLNVHGFDEHAKGLYFVGAMMYQIGMMQYHQGHKQKPILEKITYSGMSDRDIMILLNELHDKVRQYRKAMQANNRGHLVYYAEKYAERAYFYLGNLPAERSLHRDEHENLFYLMSGYSGCMRNEKKEEEVKND